jgi:hypothetical protein
VAPSRQKGVQRAQQGAARALFPILSPILFAFQERQTPAIFRKKIFNN